jgi:hypothetical protein
MGDYTLLRLLSHNASCHSRKDVLSVLCIRVPLFPGSSSNGKYLENPRDKGRERQDQRSAARVLAVPKPTQGKGKVHVK